MSILAVLIPCRNLIADTIGSALSFPPTAEKVAGAPDVPVNELPNSTIVVDGVDREFDGVRQVKEDIVYVITVRQKKPTSGVVDDFKITEAQKLGDALLAERENFNGLGAYHPQIVNYTPTATDTSKTYVEWTLTFSLAAVVFQ